MIAPSTDFSAFAKAIRSLAATPDHHYIKTKNIAGTHSHDGRTFYSKYRRVASPLSDTDIREHLAGTLSCALPLVHAGEGSTIIFLYDGDAPERFVSLFEHLMHQRAIQDYTLFSGARPSIRIVALARPKQAISQLHAWARELSDQLASAGSKNWKILPDPTLPEIANILPVPYMD